MLISQGQCCNTILVKTLFPFMPDRKENEILKKFLNSSPHFLNNQVLMIVYRSMEKWLLMGTWIARTDVIMAGLI